YFTKVILPFLTFQISPSSGTILVVVKDWSTDEIDRGAHLQYVTIDCPICHECQCLSFHTSRRTLEYAVPSGAGTYPRPRDLGEDQLQAKCVCGPPFFFWAHPP